MEKLGKNNLTKPHYKLLCLKLRANKTQKNIFFYVFLQLRDSNYQDAPSKRMLPYIVHKRMPYIVHKRMPYIVHKRMPYIVHKRMLGTTDMNRDELRKLLENVNPRTLSVSSDII